MLFVSGFNAGVLLSALIVLVASQITDRGA